MAGLVKFAGGGEPAGKEVWSMETDLSVRALMAEKRIKPEKRDVGYRRCISASAVTSQGGMSG